MKICLVTAFPPSRRGLNEYGYHLAKELQQDLLISLTVLADCIAGVASLEPSCTRTLYVLGFSVSISGS